MKQYEAVIKVMEKNGGYATLGLLYGTALKIPHCRWSTKTPFASIRRIVQDERFFFKILRYRSPQRHGMRSIRYGTGLVPWIMIDGRFGVGRCMNCMRSWVTITGNPMMLNSSC